MTNSQWQDLLRVIRGERLTPSPVGFIIDSPWLPNWYGVTILDYFTSDTLWLEANLRAVEMFPEVWFLPGFWSEFGMCTEPSAFGARVNFPRNEFPHAHKILRSVDEIEDLPVPNPHTDGLLPFVLNRLRLNQRRIEEAGHAIRFAVARGPLNIASYLMGTTEFLTAMMMEPDRIHLLIQKITRFLKDWIDLQRNTFPTIDGLLLLDDLIGFLGEREFLTFGFPYFKELYDLDVSVKFLHNDAPCRVSAPHLPEMGVNCFNMGFDISLEELKTLTGNRVTLVGNLPPRDVLASGTADAVQTEAKNMVLRLSDRSRVIFSCGGGMPPGVSTENIRAFIDGIRCGAEEFS